MRPGDARATVVRESKASARSDCVFERVARRGAARGTAVFACALALLLPACERGDEVNGEANDSGHAYVPPGPASFRYDSAVARIETGTDTLRVRVEVAERDDQRVYGLMERTALDEDAGMVFLYDDVQGAESGFWMYRTRIPLDIAFFDSAGRIVAIRQMQPCPSPDPARCPSYAPGQPYTAALEVNHGWFARHGVSVGDRIVLER